MSGHAHGNGVYSAWVWGNAPLARMGKRLLVEHNNSTSFFCNFEQNYDPPFCKTNIHSLQCS